MLFNLYDLIRARVASNFPRAHDHTWHVVPLQGVSLTTSPGRSFPYWSFALDRCQLLALNPTCRHVTTPNEDVVEVSIASDLLDIMDFATNSS